MTLVQEAYSLIQKQPEENIRLIIELMKKMVVKSPDEETTEDNTVIKKYRRLGLAKEEFSLPDDFDEVFDAMDEEIAAMFEESDL